MQLFQQQYNIFGSFGASMRNIRDSLAKMANGLTPGDRHRNRPRRSRARPRAAGKPPGVRQDRGQVLEPQGAAWLGANDDVHAAPGQRGARLSRRARAPRRSGCSIRTSWRMSAARLMRTRRAVAAGAPHRPRQSDGGLSGEVARRDRDDPARRLGQPRPRRRRVRPYRPAVGLRLDPRAAGTHHGFRRKRTDRVPRLRDDGKPALIFAAHLANWELPAVAAHSYGIDSTVLYRRPNMPAHIRGRHRHARRLHGHAGADQPGGAAPARRGAGARLACRHAGRSILRATACR